MKETKWWHNYAILIVGILLFVVNLGVNTVEIMEARNYVTVREILQGGDWLHPTMNGVLRLEKPPLPTWITAVFASLFGVKSLFFLRLPAAIMSIWLLFSMNALVKRITKDSLLAFLSAVSLAGMLYVVMLGRRSTWDIYTHSFMLAALVQLVAIFQSVKPLRRGILGGILLGASFLSKGPVALYAVFLPFILVYWVYRRPLFQRERIVALLFYVVIGAIISASWFLFIHFAVGDEAQQIIGKEVQNWTSYNVRPWYYYLKDYPVHSGIWAAILLMGLVTKYTWSRSQDKKQYRFFWLWTVAAIVLLSIIPEKKVRYLLPTFIPAAFLVASYFYYLIVDFDKITKKIDTIIFRTHWGLFTLVALALPIGGDIVFFRRGIINWQNFAGILLCAFLCFFFLLRALKRKNRQYMLVGALGLLFTAVLFIFPHTDKMANGEYKSMEEVQEFKELDNLPCYALEDTRIELVWHVGRKIKEVQSLENLQPPYLLLTNEPPKNYLFNQDFEVIGHYDNNSKPKAHRHHKQSLSKYVTVVR